MAPLKEHGHDFDQNLFFIFQSLQCFNRGICNSQQKFECQMPGHK